MVKKINHIGIAVRSIDKALEFYRDTLGIESGDTEELSQQKIKISCLPLGDSMVELIEPTAADSAIARFLDKRGEGIHHLAFEVADIEEKLKELKDKGVTLIDQTPRVGAHGMRIAFIHPKCSSGVLVELVEKKG